MQITEDTDLKSALLCHKFDKKIKKNIFVNIPVAIISRDELPQAVQNVVIAEVCENVQTLASLNDKLKSKVQKQKQKSRKQETKDRPSPKKKTKEKLRTNQKPRKAKQGHTRGPGNRHRNTGWKTSKPTKSEGETGLNTQEWLADESQVFTEKGRKNRQRQEGGGWGFNYT